MRFTKRLLGLMSLFALVRGLSAVIEQPGQFDELLKPDTLVLVKYDSSELSQTIESTGQLDGVPIACEIGETHRRRNKYGEALTYYQQCLVIYLERGDRVGASDALKSMGELLLHQRNYAVALAAYWQSYALLNEEESAIAESKFPSSTNLSFDTAAY